MTDLPDRLTELLEHAVRATDCTTLCGAPVVFVFLLLTTMFMTALYVMYVQRG